MAIEYEVYFCGKCPRQQQIKQGEKCIGCGLQTVSWYTDRESVNAAIKRWNWLHPDPIARQKELKKEI